MTPWPLCAMPLTAHEKRARVGRVSAAWSSLHHGAPKQLDTWHYCVELLTYQVLVIALCMGFARSAGRQRRGAPAAEGQSGGLRGVAHGRRGRERGRVDVREGGVRAPGPRRPEESGARLEMRASDPSGAVVMKRAAATGGGWWLPRSQKMLVVAWVAFRTYLRWEGPSRRKTRWWLFSARLSCLFGIETCLESHQTAALLFPVLPPFPFSHSSNVPSRSPRKSGFSPPSRWKGGPCLPQKHRRLQ